MDKTIDISAMLKDYKNNKLFVLATAGLLLGAIGIVEALFYGTNATNLTSYVPWGLGVATYLYFLGLSAGAFLVTILVYVFGLKRFDGLGRIAVYAGLVTEICAGGAIALDLGRWGRMYRFALSPSLESPMFWMFLFFTLLLVLYALKAKALMENDEGQARKLSLWSLPVGLLFYGTNGFFFSVVAARPIWNSGLTPVLFVTAALLSGGALMVVLSHLYGAKNQAGEDLTTGLGRVVLLLLVLFFLMEMMGYISGIKSGRADLVEGITRTLADKGSWTFWFIHVVMGTLIPMAMLASLGRYPKVAFQSCLLIVLCFLALRYDFVIPAQQVPLLPGLDTAYVHPRLSLHYFPGLGEWLVTLFFAALCLMGFILGPRLAPALFDKEQGGDHVSA